MASAITLHPYQKRWLADNSRFKIGMFARQSGKTWTTTLEIVQRCLHAESHGRRDRWVILSRGERQAKEAMDEGIKRHLKAYECAFEALEYDWEGSYKALEVALPNGSRITALPANPDTARGFSANVFLDEFAFHQDSRAIWKALFPVISNGFMLRITSTGNGKDNKFYELMESQDELWSKHKVDIYQAVADGLPRDVEELRSALNDPDGWAQEFELQWLDEASAWLPYELIETCEHADADKPDLYQGRPCFMGIDIARRHDLWVAWVLEQIGDVLWCRELVELRRASFAEQDKVVDRLMKRYRIGRMAIDQTGMGEKTVEDYQRRYGESVAEGVIFSAPTKLSLATIGKQKFEARKVRIPARAEVRQDLHSLKKSTTAIGHVRFDADRENGSHADRTWSLFLALYAAGDGAVDWSGFESISKGANSSSPYDFDFADGLSDFSGWS